MESKCIESDQYNSYSDTRYIYLIKPDTTDEKKTLEECKKQFCCIDVPEYKEWCEQQNNFEVYFRGYYRFEKLDPKYYLDSIKQGYIYRFTHIIPYND